MSKHLGIYVKQTKSGTRYQAKWRRSDGTQASKTFRTERDAINHKRHVEHEKLRGVLPDDRLAKMKFGIFTLQEVFPHQNLSPSTVLRRDGIMKKHLLPTLGDMAISQIQRSTILSLVRQWEGIGLSSYSIVNHLNVLRSVFNEAVLQDIIVRNPMDGVKPPKTKAVKRNPLTPEQCHALLEAIDPRYAYAIHFVLATGVRWSEFANMRISDFKPLTNTVSVTTSKTEAGVRVLPLDPEDTLRISKHIRDTGRNGADADSPLFTSPDGKPLNHSNFRQRIFAPACREAELKGVTFHDLRRTHATMLVAEGHDVKVVQERMGHRSISTTLTYYAIATETGKLKAAGVKNRYLKTENIDFLENVQ